MSDESIIGPIPAMRARLVVVESVYHQMPDGQPTTAQAPPHVCELETDEQPYARKYKATEEWRPLDCGWLDRASMLHVVNEEGRFLVQPTDAEREEVNRKVIELAVSVQGSLTPFAEIPPHETARFRPVDPKALRVRCRHGATKFTLTLFPV